MQRKYGFNPGWQDARDYQMEFDPETQRLSLNKPHPDGLMAAHKEVEILPVVDSKQFRGKPRDQGGLGSCGGFGSTNATRTLLRRQGYKWTFTGAALFIYYNTRSLMGTVDSDSGVDMRTLLKAFNQFGVCPEDSDPAWSYRYSDDSTTFRQRPPEECYKDAMLHRALEYYWVKQDRESIQAALSAGFTLVLGAQLHRSFESKHTAQTGEVKTPSRLDLSDPVIGGHCMAIDGYDQKADRAFGENSWGPGWGDDGGFSIGFDYLCNRKLVSDLIALQFVGHAKQGK